MMRRVFNAQLKPNYINIVPIYHFDELADL